VEQLGARCWRQCLESLSQDLLHCSKITSEPYASLRTRPGVRRLSSVGVPAASRLERA
jgi:hypothetical protein